VQENVLWFGIEISNMTSHKKESILFQRNPRMTHHQDPIVPHIINLEPHQNSIKIEQNSKFPTSCHQIKKILLTRKKIDKINGPRKHSSLKIHEIHEA
jgi:hypothetical protein